MSLRLSRAALAAAGIIAVGARPLTAQIDYRNLDEGRPVQTEDAYPVERYAFELVIGYEYERETRAERSHVLTPELAYGVLPNTMVGIELPFVVHDAAGSGADLGVAGPRVFALYNFNTESGGLPAIAVRSDLALPLGEMAGDEARIGLTGIVTRSWGRTRAHLNGTAGLGPDAAAAVHAIPEWAMSLAVDRSVLRRSLLLVGELALRQPSAGAPTEVTLAAGARFQLTPTTVLDGGVRRRLGDRAGPDLGLTIGFTHAFGVAGLMPGGH